MENHMTCEILAETDRRYRQTVRDPTAARWEQWDRDQRSARPTMRQSGALRRGGRRLVARLAASTRQCDEAPTHIRFHGSSGQMD